MSPFSKEEVTNLAFKRYKAHESYEKSVWYLSELCVTINKNVIDGYDIQPLESDNIVMLIREDVNGEIIKPTQEEIAEIAEIIYHENAPHSEIIWFIAEKTLLLKDIENIIKNNRRH